MKVHADELARGERFEFGANWARFLEVLDDSRVVEAELSLQDMLSQEHLDGLTFLDAGSGSGLFSLAAHRVGATVHSFDFDPMSVACTAELRRRFAPGATSWTVEEGSVLDRHYLSNLKAFDVVYSWGVLHHTGSMWHALENVLKHVAPGGRLFIAIYNDQGATSRRWRFLKRLYNKFTAIRPLLLMVTLLITRTGTVVRDTVRGNPSATWNEHKRSRGMSAWHDLKDWIGGYPFEVAKPEEIFDFCKRRGFRLERLITCGGGLGCNQYVFQHDAEPVGPGAELSA